MKCDLFQGDCLEIMKTIPDNSIDLIVTDPPYLHVKGGDGGKTKTRGIWKHNSYMNKFMSDFGEKEIYEFLDVADKTLKKTNMFIFCSRLQLVYYFRWILEHKKKYDLLIWDKQQHSLKSTKTYASDIEYVVRIYTDGINLEKVINAGVADNKCYMKLFSCKKPRGMHETQKPVELITNYILVGSKEDDTVLDPFMGSGTTGVACVRTNRKFIGIEKDEHYFQVAKERIEKEQTENLFVEVKE